jgi:hypothetical protein
MQVALGVAMSAWPALVMTWTAIWRRPPGLAAMVADQFDDDLRARIAELR